MNSLLIIFTRHPEPGKVKTRLIPELGPTGAAEFHGDATLWTLRTARILRTTTGITIGVCYTGADRPTMRRWLGQDLPYTPQQGHNLGDRMRHAFEQGFRAGHARIVIVGTDCPELSITHLRKAFDALASHDLVLGPAADGGYYLIGMSCLRAEVFQDITWGTPSVLAQTRRIISDTGITAAQLEQLHDIDTPADLHIWERAGGRARDVSIIIPTLNEAGQIRAAIASAQHGSPRDIIVVDGGSTDGTRALAQQCGAHVITAPAGRARQMNAGAAEARADCLLFLHADTCLPASYATDVNRILSDQRVSAGAFAFQMGRAFPGSRAIEIGTAMRARWRQLPYGDQAIFLRRRDFHELGGFRAMPLMEDYEFVLRLRRLGRIVIAPAPATISARRWQKHGALRTTLLNQGIIAAYHLGVSPERLATWYRGPHPNPASTDSL
ncbi:MAG: TIGR04283 family arsenosugar biosynthesis glycosyltransferase [Verrucomicrobia bacterium]|nr:TIGR04283 family arsenosugar biosynthesis glycosyltransferase [Verrucomicrobiota bacterium]